MHMSDLTSGNIKYYNCKAEHWKVTLIDTGLNSMTGGRIKDYIGNERFMLTYGDGVSDVNISGLLDFHKLHNKIATVTAVQPSGRFGALNIDDTNNVNTFMEKPNGDGA